MTEGHKISQILSGGAVKIHFPRAPAPLATPLTYLFLEILYSDTCNINDNLQLTTETLLTR